MDCQQVNRILDNHEAKGLTSAARYKIDAHLSACKRCADAWQAQEALLAEALAAARPGVYEAVLSRAVANSESGIPDQSRSLRRFGPLVGLAAAASVALVLVFALQSPGDDIAPGDSTESGNALAETEIRPLPEGASAVPGLMADTPVQELRFPAYQAEIHYTVLPEPESVGVVMGQVEVCEFFMFSCVHCFNLEPALEDWQQRRSDTVNLVRVPAIWNDLSRLHAQAFYTAFQLGNAEEMIPSLFEAIHVDGNVLSSRAEIRRLFTRHGIGAAAFDATFDSDLVSRNLDWAMQMNSRYNIRSTPTLTVDGRFVTDAAMAGGSYDALFGVLDALVEQVLDEEVCESETCLHRRRVEEFIRADESLQVGDVPQIKEVATMDEMLRIIMFE